MKQEVMLNIMVVEHGGGFHVCVQLGPFRSEDQAGDVSSQVHEKMVQLAAEHGAVPEKGQWLIRDGKRVQ